MDLHALASTPLVFPAIDLAVRQQEGAPHYFDVVRKKWLVLTPEEWVRQHLVHYLHHHLGYGLGLMRLEGGHSYNSRSKRSDLLVFDTHGEPYLLAEVKAPSVPLNQGAWAQAQTYQATVSAHFLALTNGLKLYCMDCQGTEGYLKQLPPAP